MEYLTEDPSVEAGQPQVVKMPGSLTPRDSSRYSHASTAEAANGSPCVANASAVRGSDMTFTTKAQDRTAAQELKKRAEKSKDRIVTKVVEKRAAEKNEDGHVFAAEYVGGCTAHLLPLPHARTHA